MPGGPEYPTIVELFYDLAFIFMFARLADDLVHDMSALNMVHTAVLFLAAWWVWVLTAWLTDLFNPSLAVIRALVLAIMLGTVLMGAATPDAFGRRAGLFVLAYYGIHVARDAVLIPATRVNRAIQARSIRIFFWHTVTAVPWFVGVFAHGTARLVLWAVAVLGDLGSARLGWPTPGLGRTDVASEIFSGTHLFERHRQIVIVAFGELIVTSGVDLSNSPYDAHHIVAFGAAFGGGVLLFSLYSQQVRALVEPVVARRVERISHGTVTSYWHLFMVAGVVGAAAADRGISAHPSGPAPFDLVLLALGGPALFLLGSFLFERVLTGQRSWARLGTAAVLLAIAPAVRGRPPLVAAVLADLALLLILLLEVFAQQAKVGRAPVHTATPR
jgi:low temperature requirement protein LtrA